MLKTCAFHAPRGSARRVQGAPPGAPQRRDTARSRSGGLRPGDSPCDGPAGLPEAAAPAPAPAEGAAPRAPAGREPRPLLHVPDQVRLGRDARRCLLLVRVRDSWLPLRGECRLPSLNLHTQPPHPASRYQQIWEFYKKAEASFWTGARAGRCLPVCAALAFRTATAGRAACLCLLHRLAPLPSNFCCAALCSCSHDSRRSGVAFLYPRSPATPPNTHTPHTNLHTHTHAHNHS